MLGRVLRTFVLLAGFCPGPSNQVTECGRLQPQGILVGRLAMDTSASAVGAAAFVVGYWARGLSFSEKIEPPACNCVCKVEPYSAPASQNSGFPFWIVGLVLCITLVVLLSNVALVLKVSLKDSKTGTDREFQIGVKGKSKGVYGTARGLALTG